MDYFETNFIAYYEPAGNDRVRLRNGRFVDVKNGCYFDPGTVVIVEGKKILYVGQEEVPHTLRADFTIDLKGKKVLPGLFNTHCHVTAMAPSLMPEIKDIKLFKANRQEQLEKNMAECLGLENSFGSIETGKVADLVILDGDPLEDCHAVGSRAAALFLDGRLTINNCGLEPVKQLSY